MSGQIKKMIDEIIKQRAKGDESIVYTTKAKILMKGVDADLFSDGSDDDPETLAKVKQIAIEFGITL